MCLAIGSVRCFPVDTSDVVDNWPTAYDREQFAIKANESTFQLKSRPFTTQENRSDFYNTFVHYDEIDPGVLTLGPEEGAAEFFIDSNHNDTLNLYGPGSNLSISLFPLGTIDNDNGNGTSSLTFANGSTISHYDSGNLWDVTVGPGPGTPSADASPTYGISLNSPEYSGWANQLGWAACKEPTAEKPDRKVLKWQLAPGSIYAIDGCANFLLFLQFVVKT
ncbi:MAG: hypothetical protein M1814_002890 [Vezdaea aestivalis]|nr:MAG: hypothetical protein M1814_002890 [Vezdaea aestivalis]